MKEEFEITLHARIKPGVGSSPVEISPIVADFRPVTPWCDGRQLGRVDWAQGRRLASRVRGGKWRRRWRIGESRAQKGRRRKRKERERGGSRASTPFGPFLSLFFLLQLNHKTPLCCIINRIPSI